MATASAPTKASLGGSWQAVGLTEEGYRSRIFIKGKLNGTRQSVGADTSRPKGNERELYRPTAQSRYPAGRQIADPYGLKNRWLLPFTGQYRPTRLRAFISL